MRDLSKPDEIAARTDGCPKNWPLWRRDLMTFLLCLLSVLASTLSPLLAANTITLLVWYGGGHSITDMALLTGWHLLGVAIAGFFFVASARVWGKRHSFLVGTVIIIISSIWGGLSGKSYNSLVAARFFQVRLPLHSSNEGPTQGTNDQAGCWTGAFRGMRQRQCRRSLLRSRAWQADGLDQPKPFRRRVFHPGHRREVSLPSSKHPRY